MSLNSYNKWKNKQIYLEFVSPQGQMDPQGDQSQTPPEQNNPMDDLPSTVNMFLRKMQNRSVRDIMQAQQVINQAFQQILTNKSNSAGRMGARNAFYNAKTNKDNFGKSF